MICPLALMLSREQIARGQIARHGVRIAFARYTDPLILLSTHSSPRLSLDPDPNVDAPAPHSPARDDADLVFRAASQEEQYHRPAGGRPVQVGPPVRRHRLAPGPGRPRRRCLTPTHPQIRPRLASRAPCHRRGPGRPRPTRGRAFPRSALAFGVGRRSRAAAPQPLRSGGWSGRARLCVLGSSAGRRVAPLRAAPQPSMPRPRAGPRPRSRGFAEPLRLPGRSVPAWPAGCRFGSSSLAQQAEQKAWAL